MWKLWIRILGNLAPIGKGEEKYIPIFNVLKGTVFELHGLGPNQTPLQVYTHINMVRQKGVIFSIRLHAEPLLKVICDLYRKSQI